MLISVVVPVYGCRAALQALYDRLTESLSTITKDYEIVFVNDSCPQNSWEDIRKICDVDNKVVGINLSRNFGQMRAILAGLENCKGDWVIVMDCDLQDRPEEIPNLYEKALEGYDVVFARRVDRKDKKSKIATSRLFFKLFSYVTDTEYDAAVGNFSICSRRVIDVYLSLREHHRDYSSYIQWIGFKQTSIDTMCEERAEGKSSYTMKKKIAYALDMLTSQSDKILQLVASAGIGMIFISFLIMICLVINYFVNDVDPGWTSIIAVIFLVGGITVSVQGVVGLYVGKTFMEVKNRPLYITQEILNRDDSRD